MDPIQTPEKVPYHKDCQDRLEEKKNVQVKLPHSSQIHLDNINFENVFLKLKAQTYVLSLRFAICNHLVYCRYRTCSENRSCRVTVQKIKVL